MNAAPPPGGWPARDSLGVTHRFVVGGHKGYLTVALDSTGRPNEIFIRMAKEGSTIRGLLDALAVSMSLGLRHGVPLRAYIARLEGTRFEPDGWSRNKEIGFAHSLVDYVARWLELRFPAAREPVEAGLVRLEEETCAVCGTPMTWKPGEPCPECGDVAPVRTDRSGRLSNPERLWQAEEPAASAADRG